MFMNDADNSDETDDVTTSMVRQGASRYLVCSGCVALAAASCHSRGNAVQHSHGFTSNSNKHGFIAIKQSHK